MHLCMGGKIFSGKAYQFAVAQHVQIRSGRLQRQLVAGGQELVVRREAGVSQSAYITAGSKPVKQGLA